MTRLRGFQFRLARIRKSAKRRAKQRKFLIEKLEDRQTAGAALPLPYSLMDDVVEVNRKKQLEAALEGLRMSANSASVSANPVEKVRGRTDDAAALNFSSLSNSSILFSDSLAARSQISMAAQYGQAINQFNSANQLPQASSSLSAFSGPILPASEITTTLAVDWSDDSAVSRSSTLDFGGGGVDLSIGGIASLDVAVYSSQIPTDFANSTPSPFSQTNVVDPDNVQGGTPSALQAEGEPDVGNSSPPSGNSIGDTSNIISSTIVNGPISNPATNLDLPNSGNTGGVNAPVIEGVSQLSNRTKGTLFVKGSLPASTGASEQDVSIYAKKGSQIELLGTVRSSVGGTFQGVLRGKVNPSTEVYAWLQASGRYSDAFLVSNNLNANKDKDKDGSNDWLESLGGGDVNADGTQDRNQDSVVTIPDGRSGQLFVLSTNIGKFKDTETFAPDTNAESNRLKSGGFSYTISDVPHGGIAAVTMKLPAGSSASEYWKWDSVAEDYLPFHFNGRTGAVFGAGTVTLYLEDGGRGDLDGVANGRIVDPGGPGANDGVVVVEPAATNTFDGWQVTQTGGTYPLTEVVKYLNGAFVLSEKDSFKVELSRTLTIPANPQFIYFEYSGTFDQQTPEFVNDAFEVAFVDTNGISILPTISYGRDSLLNTTESQGVAVGAKTIRAIHPLYNSVSENGIVNVDISGLTPGTTGKIIFRLVNNDSDTATQFKIHSRQSLIANNDAYETFESTTLTAPNATNNIDSILKNDYSPYVVNPTATKLTNPSHAASFTFNSTTGAFTYTPITGWVGVDTFTYEINDGTAHSNTATVTITVKSSNMPPIAVTNSYSMNEDQLLSVASPGVLGNDSDPNSDPITTQLVTSTTHGVLGLNADGSFQYRPDADYFGNDYFTYKALDSKGASSNVVTVTIAIAAVNDPPVANPDNYIVDASQTLTVPVATGILANDKDVEGSPLTVSTYTQPSYGTLSLNTNGSFTYTPQAGYSGNDTFSYRASDGALTSFLTLVTITVRPAPVPAKFYVPDQDEHKTFLYGSLGQSAGSFKHYSPEQRSRGATSNIAGSFLWEVESDRTVNVYETTNYTRIGFWTSEGIQPADIATNGTDIWIVDDARMQVFYYQGGAGWRDNDGNRRSTSTFNLRSVNGPTGPEESNKNPTGMVFRDGKLWITDRKDSSTARVFVYSTSGTYLGKWNLDPLNNDPTGITLNPSGGTDMWVVDRADSKVYTYAGATNWLSGNHVITGVFPLHRSNNHAEGIADPPVITNYQPTSGSQLADGATYLVSGRVSPNTADITTVTVAGTPAASVDVAGNYFQPVNIQTTTTNIGIAARDQIGATSTLNVPVTAVGSNILNEVDFSVTIPAAATGLLPQYARTSYNDLLHTLLVDLKINNQSNYSISGPILVGVKNISDPRVSLKNADGFSPSGIPYYDITQLVANRSYMLANSSTEQFTLEFNNPKENRFTYDLVVFGAPNHSPRFITAPTVSVLAGQLYQYDSRGVDPDNDQVTYQIISGPTEMRIDRNTGQVTWATTSANVGNHTVWIEVNDGRGGIDRQSFVVTVRQSLPNRPPVWVSTPVVDAYVGEQYFYDGQATDPDFDLLTYEVDKGPTGMQINSNGDVTWTPTDEYAGKLVEVKLLTQDGKGGAAYQPYNIFVHPNPLNHPPVIVSSPSLSHKVSTFPNPATGAVSPKQISLEIGPNDSPAQVPASLIVGGGSGDSNLPPGESDKLTVYNEIDSQKLLAALLAGNTGIVVNSINVKSHKKYGCSSGGDTVVDPVISVGGGGGGLVGAPEGEGPVLGDGTTEPPDGNCTQLIAATTGVYTNNMDIYGLGRHGIVLSTGNAKDYGDGPNQSSNHTSIFSGSTIDAQQIALLQPIAGNYGFFDVTQIDINFDLAESSDSVAFNVAFGSEEYQEWVGSQYIDAFGLYVNGENIAFNSASPINIDHSKFRHIEGTELDGMLIPGATGSTGGTSPTSPLAKETNTVMQFTKQIGFGATGNTLTFIIADTSDQILDTTAYISGLGGTALQPIDVRLQTNPANKPLTATPSVVTGLLSGDTAAFNTTITGTGAADGFDIHFVNNSTNQLLGTIPVGINTGYFYLVQAVDPDGDNITYKLTQAPSGATMNPNTALVTWTPPAAGTYRFVVEASDGRGGVDTQTFDVVVSQLGAGNQPPVLSAITNVTTQVGRTIEVQASATDPEGGLLKYYLTSSPTGMTIDSFSGLISWYASPGQELLPPQNVTVKVFDRNGGSDTKSFTVTTLPRDVIYNSSPTITTKPNTIANVDRTYVYDVDAIDPDKDDLTYSLSSAPDGMSIDPVTGKIGWKPTAVQEGSHIVYVTVRDVKSASDTQSFTINVIAPNEPPEFISQPTTSATTGLLWSYSPIAKDPNGDAVTYSLLTKPSGAILTAQNQIQFVPNQPGVYRFIVQAEDSRGNTATQEFLLTATTNTPAKITSTPITVVTIGAAYQYSITAVDADNDPITVTLDASSLALGMTLTGTASPWTLAWTPNRLGDFPVEITALDNKGEGEKQTFTLRVVEPVVSSLPPTITSQPSGPIFVNQTWNYVVQATDPDSPAASLVYSLQQPLGDSSVTFNTTTHTLSWTPANTTAKTFKVRVTDPQGSYSEQSFTATAQTSRTPYLPQITSVPSGPVVVGTQFVYQVEAFDRNGDALVYSLVSPPSGATISTTGLVKFTATTVGQYTLTMRVNDQIDGYTDQIFTFDVVNPPNHAPEIISVPTGPAISGVQWRYEVKVSDADGDNIALTLNYNGTQTVGFQNGVITWTPTAAGTSITATLVASDGKGGTASQTFTISAIAPATGNAPPKFVSTPLGPAYKGQRWTYASSAVDPEGGVVTYSLDQASRDRGATINATTGLVEWTPTTTGVFAMTVSAADSLGAVGSQQFKLTVDIKNAPPTFTSDPKAPAVVGQQWQYQLAATDPNDAASTLVYSLVSPAVSGSIGFDSATAKLTWTPAAVGSQTFTVRVTDPQGAWENQTFTIPAVASLPANSAPVIRSLPVNSVRLGELYKYAVNAYDPDGDKLTYQLDVKPTGMSIDAATGLIEWNPTTTGQFNVTLKVSDPAGAYQTQSYVLTVEAPVSTNKPPEITSQPSGPAARDRAWKYDVDATDPNGDTITYSMDVYPSGATINGTTGLVTWTPSGGGSYRFVVKATDSHSASTTQEFYLPVDNNAAPLITSTPTGSANIQSAYSYQIIVDDPNAGDVQTYRFVSLKALSGQTAPSALPTVNATTGLLSWTPDVLGQWELTVSVTDSYGASDSQKFTVAVVDPFNNQNPQFTDPPGNKATVGSLYLQQLKATDPDFDALTFSLISGPTGLQVDKTGVVQWKPTSSQIITTTPHSFTVQVSDGRGGSAQATYQVSVSANPDNKPPVITSTPKLTAIANLQYAYVAKATDPNGDTLAWSVYGDTAASPAPSGMVINTQTGLITWTPTSNQVGKYTVTVRVVDSQGAADSQTYELTVRGTNTPAQITSNPPVQAYLNKQYVYNVVATDADGDAIKYSLRDRTAIDDMAIDPATGRLTWIPTQIPQGGFQRIYVIAADIFGAGVEQVFDVQVLASEPNDPPLITTLPPLQVDGGTTYQYDVDAVDPENGTITYSLPSGPAGASINTSTGLIQWSAPTSMIGQTASFKVVATDIAGLSHSQSWTIAIKQANRAPTYVSSPITTVTGGAEYRYDVKVEDLDFDPLTFSLVSAPSGMTIDNNGRIRWQTSAANVGTYNFTIKVTDGRIATPVSQPVTLIVGADTSGPTVTLITDSLDSQGNPYARVGDEVVLKVSAIDDVAVATKTLTLVQVVRGGQTTTFNQTLTLDAQGQARLTITAAMIGTLTFSAKATDSSGNIGNSSPLNMLVPNPASEKPPTAQLINVPQTVSQPFTVIGTVNDDSLVDLNWLLELVDTETGSVAKSWTGTGPVNAAALAYVDTTMLRNSIYSLRLTATDDAQHKTSDYVSFTVEGALKMGNFTVGFTDLQVPLAGIPIVITRSYDSLNAAKQGDFGYGWKLDIATTKVEVQMDPGRIPDLSGYKPFRDGDRVIVTQADGTKEGFTFYGKPGTVLFGIVLDYVPAFLPDYGIKSKLIVDSLPLTKVGDDYLDYGSGHLYNPADPAFGGSYELKLRNGTSLVMDAESGELSSTVDRNGNVLQFRDDGIFSDSGKSVKFERDWSGRIKAIVDPKGHRIEYTYDDNGNLTKVKNRIGAETKFTYLTTPKHYLDTIIDPLGRTAVNVDYSTDNRVGKIKGASGSEVGMTYDVASRTETMTDPLGNVYSQNKDARGNIIREVNPAGVMTKATFDDKDRLLTQTQVIGLDDATSGQTNDLTIVNKYNSSGDLVEATDVYGSKSFTTYNDFGAPTSQTDTFGNRTTNIYDQYTGNLTYTSDSYGNSTSLTYDKDGNVKTSKDRNGNLQFTATYNTYGEMTSVTPGQGRAAEVRYNENGDAVARWTLDGVGASQVQLLSITYYDDERKVTGSVSAKLPSGQFITSGFETASIPSQYVISRSTNEQNPIGQATGAVSNEGLRTETTYDIGGRVVQTRTQTRKTNASGAEEIVWMVTRSLFDSAGRVIAQTESYLENSTDPIRGTRTVYDSAGRVEKSYQVVGLVIDLVGPNANVLEAVLTNSGSTVANTTSSSVYDSAGRAVQTTDSYGRITTTTYNTKGAVTETRQQAYDQNGNLKYMVSRTAYDSYGRAILSTDSYVEGSADPIYATESLFDTAGRSIGSNRRVGVSIGLNGGESTIASLGSIVSQSRTEYDSQGRAYKQIAADGQVSITEFDSRGRAVATLGMYVPVALVGLFQVGGATHARSRSETVYDSQGRAYQSINGIIEYGTVSGGVFTKTSTVTSQQRVTEQVYDEQGRVIKVIAPDGSFTQTEFDQHGRVKAEIDQLGNRKDLSYNSSGQLASVQLPAVPDPLNNNTSTRPTYNYQYNEFGQMSKLIDSNNHSTNFGFSSKGQSTSRTLPNGQVESFGYDVRQRQSLHVSFEGVHKVTIYDDSVAGGGRVAGYDLFASAADYNAYMVDGVDAGTEPDGNLAAGIKWERIRMTYDAFGRVLSTTHTYASGATAGQPTTVLQADIWTNSYDDQGRLVQETSPTGVIGYEYNALGRKTRTWAGGIGATANTSLSDITYDYDELGRLKLVNTVKRDGATVDGNGTASGTPPETTTYHYDLLGRPDYTEMPNEVVEDYTFDNMDRLDVMRHFKSDTDNGDLSNNQLKDIFDYSYRADGKRTGLTEKFGGSGVGYQTASSITDAVLANTYTWSYDNAGRLTSEVLDSSDNTVDQTESYIMDLAGNRIRRTIDKTGTANDVTDIYNYDASDRLQSENRYAGLYATGTPAGSATQTTSYTWNSTQQSSKTVSVPSVSSVVQSMSYGLTGQLEKVITTNSNGSGAVQSRVQVEYRYDNSGIRFIAIDTTDTNLGTTAVEGSSTGRTEYLIDHGNFTGYAQTIIETTKNASGVATKRISYTFGNDEITQTTSNLNPDGSVNGTPTTLVFGHDGHGSTAVLFGAAAAIAQIFTYSAYGELLSIHNSAGTSQALNSALTTVLYNGEGIDTRTGLYNFRARWYSPTSGRFADRLDPFAGNPNDPFSFNKYGFVHGDPVQAIDPTGMWSTGQMAIGIGIGAMIGGLSGAAIFNAAGRSGVRGFVYGALGGGSLVAAFFMGRLPGVFGEAVIGMSAVLGSSIITDVILEQTGLGHRRSNAEYAADAFEAFTFAAFQGTFARLDGWENAKDVPGYFIQGIASAILRGITESLSLLMTLLGGVITATADGSDEAKETFRVALRDSLKNSTKVLGLSPPSGEPTSFFSIMLGLMAASSAMRLATYVPGIRNLNSRSIAIISENVTKVGLVVGATALDNYLDLNLANKINSKVDEISEVVADELFKAVNGVRDAIFGN